MVERMITRNAVAYAHMLLRQHLRPGDVAIDATAGNGFDTLMLAECVGPRGVVYAFDVQQPAIDATRQRVQAIAVNVQVIHDGHQYMAAHVAPDHQGLVRAVVFNLGYLPGHDHTRTTATATTLAAIQAGMQLLAHEGLMVVVCYRHPEGERELAAVRAFTACLHQHEWIATETQFVNLRGTPPVIVTLQRVPGREQTATATR